MANKTLMAKLFPTDICNPSATAADANDPTAAPDPAPPSPPTHVATFMAMESIPWNAKSGRWRYNKSKNGQSWCPVCFGAKHCPTECTMPGEHGFCIMTEASRDTLRSKIKTLEAEVKRLEEAATAGGRPGTSVVEPGGSAASTTGDSGDVLDQAWAELVP